MSSEDQRIQEVITNFNGMSDTSLVTVMRFRQLAQRLTMGTIRAQHSALRSAAIDAAARLGESDSPTLKRLLSQIKYQEKMWGSGAQVHFATVNGHGCVRVFVRET